MKTTSVVFLFFWSLASAFSQQEQVKGQLVLTNYPGSIPGGTEITFHLGTYRHSTKVAEDGTFQVPANCPDAATVFLSNESPERSGVTMNDLARIQQHVKGTNAITDILLLQAADVNNDRKVNSEDLSVLRKFILGLDGKWPNGQPSWRFAKVPGSGSVSGESSSFTYNMTDVRKGKVLKFYGIKTGDVDGSAR